MNLVIIIIKQGYPSLIEIQFYSPANIWKFRKRTYLKEACRNGMFFNDVKIQKSINHKLHFTPRNFKILWLETAMTFPTQGSIWWFFPNCLINKIRFIKRLKLLIPVQKSDYFWN